MRAARTALASEPPLDLSVLREVLLYAISDTARVPDLGGVDLALRRAVEEIDAVVPSGPQAPARSFSLGRFIPRASKPMHSAATGAPAASQRIAGDGQPARPAISRRTRTRYGDRAFLQQFITDYFRRPNS